MKPAQNGQRMRPRHHHGSNNNHGNRPSSSSSSSRHQNYDSNGPDVRVRGNAQQVHEKYLNLARDASSSGDRIMAENYLQHAEHYLRIINSFEPLVERPPQQGERQQGERQHRHQGNNHHHRQGDQGEQRQQRVDHQTQEQQPNTQDQPSIDEPIIQPQAAAEHIVQEALPATNEAPQIAEGAEQQRVRRPRTPRPRERKPRINAEESNNNFADAGAAQNIESGNLDHNTDSQAD
ncbi:MAG: DUF4167 domain-containing protein [Alphaproteobacteria bacterium]